MATNNVYIVISGWRGLCWTLIALAALAFVVGAALAFNHAVWMLEPVGYWRGAMGFLLFAIAIRTMERT